MRFPRIDAGTIGRLIEPPHLAPAPPAPIDLGGRIAYGRYAGQSGPIDWGLAGKDRTWRFFHWKRWQYASIVGADVVAAVAIVDLGWTANGFAYLFDRHARRVVVDASVLALPGRGVSVANHAGDGSDSTFDNGRYHFRISSVGGTWTVSVDVPGLRLDAELEPGPWAATICAIARVPGGLANCTHKTHGLRVRGAATADGQTFELAGTIGALDHTSGLMARNTSWFWASGTSDDAAINLVEGFQEPMENAIWRAGQLIPLAPVHFLRDESDPTAPWQITSADGSVDLSFQPEGIRSQDKNLGVAVSRWVQPIGTYRGTVLGQDVGELVGVIEDHVARW